MKINFKPFYIQLGVLALAFSASISNSTAQINPLGAQYFQNQYLANPAMAGYQSGMRLNLGYRNQWDNIPGSPKNISVTGDYGTEKVGVGINFFKDEAGLLNRSRIQASYAYHLPLNDDSQKLHFGISLGIQTERLNNQAIVGSPNDQDSFGYFSASKYGNPLSYQRGVFRINCIDCLDRTNVVQGLISLGMGFSFNRVFIFLC